jgi:ATP-binding cassette subfamily F protein uup
LLLVSHDRDFIDRLATSTIGLDGSGGIVETPGGWADFMSQNPGFFDFATEATPSAKPAPAAPPAALKRVVKLSYKDQRRLETLEALTPKLAERIKAEESHLEDPGLYARDPAAFDRLMKSLDALRAELAAAEEEWLTLEEKREALAAGGDA